jgi:hypothetical protein
MNSLDLFSVLALMQAPQQIHLTLDLEALSHEGSHYHWNQSER